MRYEVGAKRSKRGWSQLSRSRKAGRKRRVFRHLPPRDTRGFGDSRLGRLPSLLRLCHGHAAAATLRAAKLHVVGRYIGTLTFRWPECEMRDAVQFGRRLRRSWSPHEWLEERVGGSRAEWDEGGTLVRISFLDRSTFTRLMMASSALATS